MKAKTLLELLTLSTNIYMISKDEKFMGTVKEMAEKGKEKVAAMAASFEEHGEDDKILERFYHKAQEAKAEFEEKMAEVAEKIYAKMNIAHREDLMAQQVEIERLKKELLLAEARIVALESRKK